MSKFPEKLFVAWDGEGEDALMLAVEKPGDVSLLNDKRTVGIYQLKEVAVLESTEQITLTATRNPKG